MVKYNIIPLERSLVMSEKKNDDIKFEDLVDNYTYQNNNNQGHGGNSYTPPPFWSQPQPQPQKSNGLNIACLVCGIISIVCCCIYGIISIICGILAIVFFVLSKKSGNTNGIAIAGLICAIFGLILGLFYGGFCIIFFEEIMAAASEMSTSTF